MRKSLTRLLVLAVAGSAVVLSRPDLAAQQQAFRSSTQTVALYATVTDAERRLIPNLEKEHFEVLDNGKPQPITIFKSDIQPITVAVMLDASGSMVLNMERLKTAAEAFVLRLLPEDKARVASFDDKIFANPTFTNNRDDLIRFLHNDLQYGNGTKLWDAIDFGMTAMTRETGRRVVLAFTDGDDTASKADFDRVLARAAKEEFMVYAIGFRSMYRGGPNGSMIESRPDRDLKKLAEETGGGYWELRQADDLNQTFSRVADELHRQYVIGFTPETLDGKVHKLDVRVKIAGMNVRARRSYIANNSSH